MKTAKMKLSAIVHQWEKNNPVAFSLFLESRRVKTDTLANQFAETPGSNFILRLMYDIPEDLEVEIRRGLDDAEGQWLSSTEGAQWFMKTFKQYNVSQRS